MYWFFFFKSNTFTSWKKTTATFCLKNNKDKLWPVAVFVWFLIFMFACDSFVQEIGDVGNKGVMEIKLWVL